MGKSWPDRKAEAKTNDLERYDRRRQDIEDQEFEVGGGVVVMPTPRIAEALRRADARQQAYRDRMAASAHEVSEAVERQLVLDAASRRDAARTRAAIERYNAQSKEDGHGPQQGTLRE